MPFPGAVAVIGGGRWARELTETLCGVVPETTRVSMHSVHFSRDLEGWLRRKCLAGRVDICAEWPSDKALQRTAVVVANAARDHEAAARRALGAGAAVLVEKPLALSAVGARELMAHAQDMKGRLAAAHVFLFASYLDVFSNAFIRGNAPKRVRVRWVDPAGESRYGERKSFDSGVPILSDVLPHISSILEVFVSGGVQRCADMRVHRGGAEVELALTIGTVSCEMLLLRGGERRERSIEVAFDSHSVCLDFSVEPGTIFRAGVALDADTDWKNRKGPLHLMLQAFLIWAGGGEFDSRLSVDRGVRACALIDEVSSIYKDAQADWLESNWADQNMESHWRYALTEILQSEARLSPAALEFELRRMRDKGCQVIMEKIRPGLMAT